MSNPNIDISQIPEDVKNVLREKFDKDPKICLMRIQAQTAQQRGDYLRALSLNKEIDFSSVLTFSK